MGRSVRILPILRMLQNRYTFQSVLVGVRILRIRSMGRKGQKSNSLPSPLDMLILRTLTRANLHGYAIAQMIQNTSGDEILVEEGSLYPALQRLELNGWIDGQWGLTPNNRQARIFHLTPLGRRQLA